MGKILLVAIILAGVIVSCTSPVKTTSEVAKVADTKEEAFSEREGMREWALEERREGGDMEEQGEWREWDNEWLREFDVTFGAGSADNIKPAELDPPSEKKE